MPLYHPPKPLPLHPARGANYNSNFQKTVPFGSRTASVRREFRSRRVSAKPTKPIPNFNTLAGAAIGVLAFSWLALTLFLASVVWANPHHTGYLCAFFLAYLIGTFATTRALRRRVRASNPLDELQPRFCHGGQNLSNLLRSAHRDRMPRVSDF